MGDPPTRRHCRAEKSRPVAAGSAVAAASIVGARNRCVTLCASVCSSVVAGENGPYSTLVAPASQAGRNRYPAAWEIGAACPTTESQPRRGSREDQLRQVTSPACWGEPPPLGPPGGAAGGPV